MYMDIGSIQKIGMDIGSIQATDAPESLSASGNLFISGQNPTIGMSGDLFIWGRDTRFCLYSDNVVFYHPIDDYIEATLEEPWQENVVEFSGGILVSGAMATSGSDTFIVYDNQTGGYPSLGGVTSIAIAFWSKDFFRAGLDAALFVGNSSSPTSRADENGIHLHTNNKPMVHVSGVGGQSIRSIESIPNDGEWHFVVIYAEVSGGQWRIYESTDDAPSMELVTNDSTSALQMGDQRYFMIHLENPDEAVIDEIICWTGLSQPFTRDEITILYTLASLHGLRMNQSSDHLDITSDKDLFINGHISNVGSGDLFTYGYIESTGSGDLYINGHESILASGNLFIHGPELSLVSGNLFIDGHIGNTISGDLFVEGHIDTMVSGDLFIDGHEPFAVSGDLLIEGHIDTSGSAPSLFIRGHDDTLGRPFDWLLRTSDHYPQIIGTFDNVASGVNIQVWDVIDGQNTLMSIANSGCYEIGNTNRWGWSTVNLPTTQGYARHYFYLMTSDISETFDGQFIMDVPEGAKWIHPNNQSEYLK